MNSTSTTMAVVPEIENYKEHLAFLLQTFITEPSRGGYGGDDKNTFTDEFGNSIAFGHTEPACTGVPLLKLLRAGESAWINIDDVDKGHLSYRLDVYGESYFMVYQLKVDLYGWCGKFDSFVVVRSLDPLIEFLEKRMGNKGRF